MHQRIVVLGCSGSGKTTLARQLAAALDVPMLELDAVHWKPNWTSSTAEEMTPVIARHIAQPAWTVDGNYGKVRDMILSRADTIIWLDYSLGVVLWRVATRTFRRCWTGEELWAGNRENFWMQVATKDSIFVWVLGVWRKRRAEYPKLLPMQKARGKRVYRFRKPKETAKWLAAVTARV
jgi:adenylate kinase family enzyme